MPSTARAGFIEDAAFGLGYIAFDIEGQRNPLSGGIDLIVTRNFVGNPLDFGAADLTLQGPLSFQLSTATRGIGQIELSFTTAINRNSFVTPLDYLLDVDVGGQATQVSGSLLVDTDLSINQFGFYDLNVFLSSRQDITQDGRFANGQTEHDLDVGPLNLSGNIIADILALITDPFFDAAGLSNTFARFSGASSVSAILTDTVTGTLAQLADGNDPVAVDREKTMGMTMNAIPFDVYTGPPPAQGDSAFFLVPEPGVLLLLAAGIPAIIGPRFRRNR